MAIKCYTCGVGDGFQQVYVRDNGLTQCGPCHRRSLPKESAPVKKGDTLPPAPWSDVKVKFAGIELTPVEIPQSDEIGLLDSPLARGAVFHDAAAARIKRSDVEHFNRFGEFPNTRFCAMRGPFSYEGAFYDENGRRLTSDDDKFDNICAHCGSGYGIGEYCKRCNRCELGTGVDKAETIILPPICPLCGAERETDDCERCGSEEE